MQDEPVKGNDRVPDEGEILDILSQPVDCHVAPVAELSDLSNARSESPKVPPGPQITTATPAEPDETGDLAADMLVKILKPKHAWKVARAPAIKPLSTSPPEEDAVALPLPAVPHATPEPKPALREIVLPRWLFITDGQLNPNVIFVLGIWVGIGLSAAAFAILTISGWLRIVAD
jgi:hypothetical protein